MPGRILDRYHAKFVLRYELRRRTVGPQSRNQESFWATSITSTVSGSCFLALSTCAKTFQTL